MPCMCSLLVHAMVSLHDTQQTCTDYYPVVHYTFLLAVSWSHKRHILKKNDRSCSHRGLGRVFLGVVGVVGGNRLVELIICFSFFHDDDDDHHHHHHHKK
ncbi:hypothetical protein IF1G_08196 [Cordyceps javanica]|uniref:Secreted protein n=1 Tax=Cordyceps javanica TaxID=43265 RepID=A0A545UTU2_9HYPO|nr:hypothetical protein IF1G_08196 [Cordyceps javanica]